MTTLHPDLLRACAAYLAHADAYCLDSDDQMELLRSTANSILVGRASEMTPAERVPIWSSLTGPDVCDELTHAHIEAIRRHGQFACTMAGSRVGVVAVSHAIRDATPAMLAWWCERLAR